MFLACGSLLKQFKDITKLPLILSYISIMSHANREFVWVLLFTACQSDKLYLAGASRIGTLTCPKRIFNQQD